ncbi:3-deoxy-7-phosphoheptulonate synthase [Symbiobacterium terraclitae]|uniref:3-deoxy-7-phosphoheptulonate synthase n=1 Tax=Symbiobacterium terraclitae TaxID=557451 RepID=A0ABS4JWD2_9FIRM|nr:3-deoxy-7-phosphoheptulonate synthase [Symbiobacterium terraclitae]
MIIVMRKGATQAQVNEVVERVRAAGFGVHLSQGEERTIIGAIGGDRRVLSDLNLEAAPGVERVTPISKPYKLVSRDFHPEDTVIRVGGATVGGSDLWVVAGPCSVEGRELLLESARLVRDGGAHALRAGAFKPRSSPYSFQGLGEEGLKYLAEARALTGLPVVTEVMDTRDVELVAEYADVLQIGTRNMQNFSLLKEVGRTNKPVLLKRGMSATIEEWLMAAEYVMSEGNHQVILCERGVRTFETATRNTLDLSAVVVAKSLTHLPVVVDPSHGVGKRAFVGALARAAVAAGADGILVEVHQRPDEAKSDAAQTIGPTAFHQMMHEIAAIAQVLGRRLPTPVSAHV